MLTLWHTLSFIEKIKEIGQWGKKHKQNVKKKKKHKSFNPKESQ